MLKPTLTSIPTTKNIVIAKGDSAALQNYWRPQDKACLTELQEFEGTPVILPSAATLNPTEKGIILLSAALSKTAKTATVLKNLNSSSLISLGQIYDDNCTIILTKNDLLAAKDENIKVSVEKKDIILKGTRNFSDGLYDIPIPQEIQETYVLPELKGFRYTNLKEKLKQQQLSQTNHPKSSKMCRQEKTINNMSQRKFNHIIKPFIDKNTKMLIPVSILTPKLNVIL